MRMKFQKFATWMLILPVAISFAAAGLSEAAAKEKVRIGVAVSWPGYAFYELARVKDMAPAYDMEISKSQIGCWLCARCLTILKMH